MLFIVFHEKSTVNEDIFHSMDIKCYRLISAQNYKEITLN